MMTSVSTVVSLKQLLKKKLHFCMMVRKSVRNKEEEARNMVEGRGGGKESRSSVVLGLKKTTEKRNLLVDEREPQMLRWTKQLKTDVEVLRWNFDEH